MSCRPPAELVGLHRNYVATATAQDRDHAQDVSNRVLHSIRDMTPGRSDEEEG